MRPFVLMICYFLTYGKCEELCVPAAENRSGDEVRTIITGNITNGKLSVDLVSSIIESENVNINELKGKLCLKNMTKCMEEDEHQRSCAWRKSKSEVDRNLHGHTFVAPRLYRRPRTMTKKRRLYKAYQNSVDQLSRYLLDRVPPFDLSNVEGINEECRTTSKKYIDDLNLFRFWALQMYDATAKIPSGILSGNVIQFGDFDLCMKPREEEYDIYGRYCLSNTQISVPNSAYLSAIHRLVHSHSLLKSNLMDPGHRVPRYSSIQWGFCVPDACTHKDVDLGLRAALQTIFNGTEIVFDTRIDPEMCQSARPKQWPKSTIIGFVFFASVIIWELYATIYDLYRQENRNDYIVAFSLRKNLNKITSPSRGENDIDAVHVIRFINAIMLLAAHKSMALLYLPYVNRTDSSEILGQPWTVVGRAASLYTDPFIMISGTLTAYSLFGRLQKTNKIKIVEEYVSRVLRILPTFAGLIIFCTFVLPWTNSGPLWHSVVTHHSDICKKYWWRNMLFIHNYFGFQNMCLTHTHHVGIDTQLFFLSPFLVLLVWKWPRRGLFTLFTIATVSTGMRYYATYTRKLSNYVHFGTSTDQLFKTADYMYILPTHRLTVYIMGILLGYLLREYRNVKLKAMYIHLGNILALACFCGALFVPAFMGNIDYIYNPRDAAWYAAYAPILWCLCFAWFIYITHVGHRSYVKFILRNSIPKLWANVSYTVYLTQFPIFFYNVGITKHSDDYGVIRKHLNLLETFWIIAFSMALSLMFEFPSQNIRNIIFRRDSPARISSPSVEKKKLM